jgi:Putative transposase
MVIKKRKMTLDSQKFLRRFLLHVLPRGFVRIRFFGFMANRRRATLLPLCQRLLADHPLPHPPPATTSSPTQPTCFRCPKCSTPMVIVERLSALMASQLTTRERAP